MSNSEAQSSGSLTSKRGPRPRLFAKNQCQADSCDADLSALPYYNRRNHICHSHKIAESYTRMGDRVRFCFRCGVAHPLHAFDGNKRSCREKLEKFNARRRKAPAAAVAGTPSPSVSSAPSAPATSELAAPAPAALELQDAPEMVVDFAPPPPLLLPPPDDVMGAAEDPALPELSLGDMASEGSSILSDHASAVSDDEGICCATSGDERICCADSYGMEPATPLAGPANGAGCSAAAVHLASGVAAGDSADAAAVGGGAGACDRDDPNSSGVVSGDNDNSGALPAGNGAAAAAAFEAELAALRATDAALYAVMVQQQFMRARLLMATGEALMRRSLSGRSLSLSRRGSSEELSVAMVS